MKTTKNKTEILEAFKTYKNTVFSPEVDISFWKPFFEKFLEEYKRTNSKNDALLSSIFCAYDFSLVKGNGLLKSSNNARIIERNSLTSNSNAFFSSLSVLIILKNYIATETFIRQAIHIKYFLFNGNLMSDKKTSNKVDSEIKSYLKENKLETESKNNRHIIQFLKSKSRPISSFLCTDIRTDINTTWQDFFEVISILRNIIAHQNQTVHLDTVNEIKAKGIVLFRRFLLTETSDNKISLTFNIEQLSNFLSFYHDFSLNIVKFIFEEENLEFLEMY